MIPYFMCSMELCFSLRITVIVKSNKINELMICLTSFQLCKVEYNNWKRYTYDKKYHWLNESVEIHSSIYRYIYKTSIQKKWVWHHTRISGKISEAQALNLQDQKVIMNWNVHWLVLTHDWIKSIAVV